MNSRPLPERFWEKVDKSGECWVWTAATFKGGYGQIWTGYPNGKNDRAHRVSWRLSGGFIGDRQVLHACDNPSCVRPGHLFLGTHADNMNDMDAKGRRCPIGRGEKNTYAKISEKDAIDILTSSESGASAARRLGVTPSAISCIRVGKSWKYLNRTRREA